jgi:hypothetical protein
MRDFLMGCKYFARERGLSLNKSPQKKKDHLFPNGLFSANS